MQRTCIVANPSNLPFSTIELSIHTGLTFAEYFRDQGLNITYIAHSFSRWGEALRNTPTYFSKSTGDSGYPMDLKSRLISFFDRAGKVQCIGSPERQGSVTILGSASPGIENGMSEPVMAATLEIAQAYWHLDIQLARRKHFPSVSWTSRQGSSYVIYVDF
jgi:V-type H+-transporting ATPase subunit A